MNKINKYIIALSIVVVALIILCFIPISVTRLIPVIEEQVSDELGVKVHLERLILRVGPTIKIKAPILHLLYEDGQKFGQLNNVKFYIPLHCLFKRTPQVSTIQARRLILKINSDDKYLSSLLDNLKKAKATPTPAIKLKEYNISYNNKKNSDKYLLYGNNLDITRRNKYKNVKIKTTGAFNINSQDFVTYDIILAPNLELPENIYKFNYIDLVEQIKELDFHSDIIADLKIYENLEGAVQASGFINVDNISILDITKKSNKSFVYLTLWGDKASILSNIYTSPNKKIYIEGVVKNSKKLLYDLKVKSDEILISELYQKLKILADISFLKDVEDISGKMIANFTLKGDLNKIKSSGYMRITDASIKADGLNINKINSDIDFSNNRINILKAVGSVNGAPIILKGSIDKNVDIELLMNKVNLKYLLPNQLGVTNGIISVISRLTGTLDNITHKEKVVIENLKIRNNLSDLSIESFNYDTNKSNVAYINNVICDLKKTERIKIPSAKLVVNSNYIKISDTQIYMPNSKLTLKSEILDFNNNAAHHVTTIDGFINSKDIYALKDTSTRYPLKLIINGNKTVQNINSQIVLEKSDIFDEPTLINFVAKLEKNILKIEDLGLFTFNGDFQSDIKQNIKGNKKLSISGTIDNIKNFNLKNIRLFIPQQLNLNIFDTRFQLKGDLFLNGLINKPEIVGQLNISNLFNQELQMVLSNCNLDFNKNNIILNTPLLKIMDTSFAINGLVSTDITNGILIKNINIKSKFLNTDTILMYKDSPILKNYAIKILEGKIYSEKVLTNLYGTALYFSALTSDLGLLNDVLTLKNVNADLLNGKINGNITYNLKDEHFNSQIMGRGVSAEPIFNIVSPKKDSINGIMNFDTDLRGELITKESLNGNVKFIINNGRMSTLGKLEHLLYAQNIIADNMLRTSLSIVTKAITLRDTGLFKDLRGDIDLENGVANIKMLQSQGPLMTLFIKGQYNTLNNCANLVVLGRLSDEIIDGLGAFGDFSLNKLMIMLTGEDKQKVVTVEDFEKIPQLPIKKTKEFRSVINGIIDKPSSVVSFNWISYSEKSLRQKEVQAKDAKVPDFVDSLPY